MHVLKKLLGLTVVGMALGASLPADARLATNRLASNKLASNKLSTNSLLANAGEGAFIDVLVIDLPNGSRVTY